MPQAAHCDSRAVRRDCKVLIYGMELGPISMVVVQMNQDTVRDIFTNIVVHSPW